jgi:hypothetical protein
MENKFSKELIEQKVFHNDANWFYRTFYNNDYYEDEFDKNIEPEYNIFTEKDIEEIRKGKVKIVYCQNYGDGNDYDITFHFSDFDFYVSIEGYYSSYATSEFHKVYFSEPFEYKEIRYKRKNK